MTQQLPLRLPPLANTARSDFFVSPANALALAEIDRWREWPQGKLVLTGPAASGKSHLARIWAHAARARVLPAAALVEAAGAAGPTPATTALALVVEDVPQLAGHAAAEEALLHLHNLILADGGRLLMTGIGEPSRWGLALPDLASRIAGTANARLDRPDDALLSALLVKHFADRGVAVAPNLVSWLAARIERSFADVRDVVDRLDAAALASGRPLGPKLAREVLDDLADEEPDADAAPEPDPRPDTVADIP